MGMANVKVVIIGNGIAGFSAASTLRRLNRDRCHVTLISREPHPLYSACVLPDYIAGELRQEQVFVKSHKDYQNLNIETVLGREVKEIDTIHKKVALESGEPFPFDKLLLATGSEPVVFEELKKGVFKLKTLNDAEAILGHDGKKAVIIGAGAIGIEIGIALRSRGYCVTILEMLDQILPLGLDQKPADRIKGILEEHDIEVFNGERGEKILGDEQVEGLLTNKREIACDTLVWAVGMRPRIELARKAGIALGEKGGIRVNARMETNLPDVYACGDCVESNDILTGEPYLNLFWHNANRQGTVAARNCMGTESHYPGSQNVLNIDVFGNHIAGFGFTEATLYRFKDIKAFGGRISDLSIIERERDGSYLRLVILGDRCIGGQFINVDQVRYGVGLLWSMMFRKRSVKELIRIFENEEMARRKPWLQRVRPFFK